MINLDYDQLIKYGSNRGRYLKSNNENKLSDTEANNRNNEDGPVLREDDKS